MVRDEEIWRATGLGGVGGRHLGREGEEWEQEEGQERRPPVDSHVGAEPR